MYFCFQAAEKLLQIVHSGSDVSLYKYLDLIEITSQHYAMTRKFDSALESFLSEGNIKQEYSIPNLQLRYCTGISVLILLTLRLC